MRVSLVVLAVLAAAACKKATPPEPLVVQPTPAPVVTQAVPPVVAPEPAMPVRFETAYFDFDSSALRPEAKAALAQGAIVLREYPALRVTLEGHCDERGTTEYNLALGGRRAAAAEQYLIGEGIAPSRLTTVSYGEERPVALGHDETSWALNRRVEFHVPGGPEPMAVAP